ncbi:MAG: metal-dependent transcriptional regulator [Candidatus Thorarchaeota archaeon]
MTNIHESYENYLKAIYLISKNNKGGWISNLEISNFLNVKPSSVTNMLYNLKAHELIDWRPRKSIRLTKKGKEIALYIIQNYNSLFKFFSHVLKLKNKNLVQKLSCEIEHYINPEVSNALENLILKSYYY